jgi:hypothetical protein
MRECPHKEGNPLGHHPSLEELESFVFCGTTTERTRAVVVHLVRGCKACSTRLEPLRHQLCGTMSRVPVSSSVDRDYDEAIDRAIASLQDTESARLRIEAAKKRRLALRRLVSRGIEGLQDAPSEFQGLPLFELLLESSWAVRHDDPCQDGAACPRCGSPSRSLQ